MAKQRYEELHTISLCGLLDRNEDGRYIVTVEGKDSFKEYDLADVLEKMEGTVISLTSTV